MCVLQITQHYLDMGVVLDTMMQPSLTTLGVTSFGDGCTAHTIINTPSITSQSQSTCLPLPPQPLSTSPPSVCLILVMGVHRGMHAQHLLQLN